MVVVFAPPALWCEVKTIEMHHESIPEALPGDMIGFTPYCMRVSDFKRGYVCSDSKNDPARETNSFMA